MINIQIFAWALVAVGLTGAGSYGLGYMHGREAERATDRTAQLQAQVNDLQRALTAEHVAAQSQQIVRTVIEQRTNAIQIETTHSVQIVRGMWDRPACVVPERVRAELQTRIDKANAAASEL